MAWGRRGSAFLRRLLRYSGVLPRCRPLRTCFRCRTRRRSRWALRGLRRIALRSLLADPWCPSFLDLSVMRRLGRDTTVRNGRKADYYRYSACKRRRRKREEKDNAEAQRTRRPQRRISAGMLRRLLLGG